MDSTAGNDSSCSATTAAASYSFGEPGSATADGQRRRSRTDREALQAAAMLAAAQYGAITRKQLIACGMSGRQAERRAGEGRLQSVARGVYVVPGTPPSWERNAIAAQLFTATRLHPSVLSHETAGALYGFVNCRRGGPIVMTSHATDRHPNPLAVMVRACDLEPDDIVIGPLGIPTTSAVRTVLDLALRTTRVPVIEAIIEDACGCGAVTLDDLAERIARAHNRAGIVNVRRALTNVMRRERKRAKAATVAVQRAQRREARFARLGVARLLPAARPSST